MRHILSKWDEDALFGTFSPPGNALVMQRTRAGLQSVATGLWDYDAYTNAFAVIDGRAFASWTTSGELFEAFKGAFRASGIDPERVTTGYDSLMAGGRISTDANHAFDVGRGESPEPPSPPKEALFPVWVADLRGAYRLQVESLDHLGVFDPDMAGYSMARVADGGAQLLSDPETTRYLITSPDHAGTVEINGMHHRLAGRESVLYLLPGTRVGRRSLEDVDSGLVVQERHVPQEYERFHPDRRLNSVTNATGVRQIGHRAFEFVHQERRSPWDGSASEWNIDSISGLEPPYPSIAVSRRSARLEPRQATNFHTIRSEERPHLHPNFTEVYHCTVGAIYLRIFTRGYHQTLVVEEGGPVVHRSSGPNYHTR